MAEPGCGLPTPDPPPTQYSRFAVWPFHLESGLAYPPRASPPGGLPSPPHAVRSRARRILLKAGSEARGRSEASPVSPGTLVLKPLHSAEPVTAPLGLSGSICEMGKRESPSAGLGGWRGQCLAVRADLTPRGPQKASVSSLDAELPGMRALSSRPAAPCLPPGSWYAFPERLFGGSWRGPTHSLKSWSFSINGPLVP